MRRRRTDGVVHTSNASPSPYDTQALRERADRWRVEAARATLEAVRVLCVDEAEKCERRLQQSFWTPIVRGLDGP
jgi:hypothetical protein